MYNFDMEQEVKQSEIKRETVYHENIKDNEYLPVFFALLIIPECMHSRGADCYTTGLSRKHQNKQ